MSIILPTLNYVASDYLNDTSGKPSSLTFTRVSTATYVNAIGQIASAASGVLRHDYDPVTGAYLGWLIEEQRSNLLLQSANVGAAWTAARVTLTPFVSTAPDGTSTAGKVIEDNTTNSHGLNQAFSCASGQSYTHSCWVKRAVGTRNAELVVHLTTTVLRATFDFDAVTASVASGSGTVGIKSFGSGWYRIWAAATATGTGTGYFQMYLLKPGSTADNYAGDGTSGVYIWGMQVEAGAFPTSYIPTTTSTATRNADVLTVTTSGFGFNAAEGTLYVGWMSPVSANVSGGNGIVAFDDGSGNNVAGFYLSGGNSPSWQVTSGGSTPFNAAAGTISANTLYKSAGVYKANNWGFYQGGMQVDTSSVASAPPVGITTLRIGGFNGGSTVGAKWYRHIAYFPRSMVSADLQLITT